MAKPAKALSRPAKETRMQRLRRRRREGGDKQITTYLSAQAAELLVQMIEFSGETQTTLVDEAIQRLAFDYSYWGVQRRYDDGDDWFDDKDSSHYEDSRGHWVENPHYGKPTPPWIVQRERERIADSRAIQAAHNAKGVDGAEVYRRGIDRNRLR